MNYKKLAEAALEKRASLISEIRSVNDSTTLSATAKAETVARLNRDISAAEAEARTYVEEGEREAEFRTLAANAGALAAVAHQGQSGSEWRTLLPSGEEFRVTQTVSVAGDGGYTAPKGVADEYVNLLRAKSAVARVLPASSIVRFLTNEFVLPQISASSSPAKVAEAANYGEGSATFTPLSFTSVKIGEVRWASVELHNDSALDIRRLLSDDMLRSAAAKLDALCIKGVLATDGFTGLTATGNSTTTTLGAGVSPGWDHISDAVGAIEAANGTPSAVLVSTDIYAALRKAKDGDGTYIGDPTRAGSATAWGLTLAPSSAVPAKTAIVMDASRTYLGIRDEVRVSIDESARWESDQIGYKVSMRVAGMAVAEASSVQVVVGG
jgi:HK97 family phage major capsid protein